MEHPTKAMGALNLNLRRCAVIEITAELQP